MYVKCLYLECNEIKQNKCVELRGYLSLLHPLPKRDCMIMNGCLIKNFFFGKLHLSDLCEHKVKLLLLCL